MFFVCLKVFGAVSARSNENFPLTVLDQCTGWVGGGGKWWSPYKKSVQLLRANAAINQVSSLIS
jgi:hypothetical protein